jgi:hypothetical protein
MKTVEQEYNYRLNWEGIDISIRHRPKYIHVYDHIEVKAEEVLPITETGYRSIFLLPSEIEEVGGAQELVLMLLNQASESQDWKEHKEQSRQASLF